MTTTLMTLATAAFTLVATASAAAPQESGIRFGDSHFTHEMMRGSDAAAGLEAIFDIYEIEDRGALRDTPCFTGDIGRVCSLLSKMSKYSDEMYINGNHQMATLEGCRVLGRGKPVEARILMVSDYSPEDLRLTQVIDRCE